MYLILLDSLSAFSPHFLHLSSTGSNTCLRVSKITHIRSSRHFQVHLDPSYSDQGEKLSCRIICTQQLTGFSSSFGEMSTRNKRNGNIHLNRKGNQGGEKQGPSKTPSVVTQGLGRPTYMVVISSHSGRSVILHVINQI